MDLIPWIGLTLKLAALAVLLVAGLLYAAVSWARGRRTRSHSVFIAATPKTVWDTFFFHVGQVNYRSGFRILSADILSRDPLTVRTTAQLDLDATPVGIVTVYDLYEPYRRYRSHISHDAIVGTDKQRETAEEEEYEETAEVEEQEIGEDGEDLEIEDGENLEIFEEGELRKEGEGTRLCLTISSPRRGLVLPGMVRRRTERNLRNLKTVCEGGQLSAPRRPLPWRLWHLGLIGVSLPFLFVGDIRVKLVAATVVASVLIARLFGVLRRL